MSVEIEGRTSAEWLQFGGITKEIYKRTKTTYTRAFLLSCADLDICKEFPKGFQIEPSILGLPKDAPKSILESWRGSGALSSIRSSGNSEGSLFQSIKWDTCCNFLNSGARWNDLSLRRNDESNLDKKDDSEFRRHDDILHCLPKASGLKDGFLSQNIKETGKIGFYQLHKSDKPYHPPQYYKSGNTNSEKTNCPEDIHFTRQRETQTKAHTISSDENHDILTFSAPITESNGNTVNLFLATDNSSSRPEIVAKPLLNACEDEIAVTNGESNGKHSGMSLKEHIGSSFQVSNGSPSTLIQMEMPQNLAAELESKMGHTGNLCLCRIEGLSSVITDSSEQNSVHSETRQDHNPNIEIEVNEFCCNRKSNSGQIGLVDRITRTENSEPCQFRFLDAFDFLRSDAGDCNVTGIHHKCITAADVVEETELYEMDGNQSTFEDVWSEVLSIIQFEQEMDLNPVVVNGETAGSEVKICLPKEDSLISIAYPSSFELSKANNCDDNADSDDEICLPDENDLICIDDLIAPHCLKLTDDENSSVKDETLSSNLTDKVAKVPEALDISSHEKRSAIQDMTASPFHVITAPLAHQELHFHQSYLQNTCTRMNAKVQPLDAMDSQQAQISLQMPLMDPMAPHCNSALRSYSCINIHNQPSPKEVDGLVQYSLLQQPTNFPQFHELSIHAAPMDPRIKKFACYEWGPDKLQNFPLVYQQTNYPYLPILDSGVGGFNHPSTLNRFIGMGRWSRCKRASTAAWHDKKPPTKNLT